MTFSSLESLKKYLIKDSKELAINPVRFVSVDSLAMWIEVKKMLLGLADESISPLEVVRKLYPPEWIRRGTII